MDLKYLNKYLKYKTKYLALRGGEGDEEKKRHVTVVTGVPRMSVAERRAILEQERRDEIIKENAEREETRTLNALKIKEQEKRVAEANRDLYNGIESFRKS